MRKQRTQSKSMKRLATLATIGALSSVAQAQDTADPIAQPDEVSQPEAPVDQRRQDSSESFEAAFPVMVSKPVDQVDLSEPGPLVEPWSLGAVQALIAYIEGVGSEGLDPSDYDYEALQVALQDGLSVELDELASKNFVWLVEDIRDGRTPMDAREQWFVVDPDRDLYRTRDLLAKATQTGDVAGVLC